MAVTVNRFLKVNFGTLNFGNVDDIIRNESSINFLRFVIFSKVSKKDQKNINDCDKCEPRFWMDKIQEVWKGLV